MAEREPLTAVLLFNYGGPESLADVRPYLRNIFSDPSILDLPPLIAPLRPALAWLISTTRAPSSRRFYGAIGGRSPLNEETRRQAKALAAALEPDGRFLVLPAMRYWRPRTDDAIREALEAGAGRFVLLPLYPHHSRTTTGSAIADFRRAVREAGADHLPVHGVDGYHDHPGFIGCVANTIAEELRKLAGEERDRATILFSAHGLPRRIVDDGDLYPGQVEQSVKLVIEQLGFKGDVRIAYQSKVGPMRWLEPDTGSVIRKFTEGARGPLLVYPISFVSEHQETLYELDIKYGAPARAAGIDYRRLPAAGCRPEFIGCLRDLTRKALSTGAR